MQCGTLSWRVMAFNREAVLHSMSVLFFIQHKKNEKMLLLDEK